MEIIFVRHGESIGNALKDEEAVYTGRWDCDLSDNGREQAKALRGSQILQGADVCFVSNLKRALETARIITDAELVIDPRIQERSLGDFEQKRIVDVMRTPEYARYFSDPELMSFRNSFSVSAPGGESYSDVCDRVKPFLDELMLKDYRKVIIVSHYVVIKCMMKELNKLSEEETIALKVPNCEPIRIKTD